MTRNDPHSQGHRLEPREIEELTKFGRIALEKASMTYSPEACRCGRCHGCTRLVVKLEHARPGLMISPSKLARKAREVLREFPDTAHARFADWIANIIEVERESYRRAQYTKVDTPKN